MALPTSYKVGTVAVAANGTTVTGTGTSWVTAGLRAGDVFAAGGLTVSVASVNSATSLTLAFPWAGPALSGAAYEVRFVGDSTRVLAASREAIATVEAIRGEVYANTYVFNTTAEGIANSVAGQQFQVKVGTEMVRYRHSPTHTAIEVGRYASAETVNNAVTNFQTAADGVVADRAKITRLDTAVAEVAAPAIRRSTDAQYRVHELMDLGGGLHLPGLRGLSVQEHVSRLYTRLAESAQAAPYQTVVNAVSDLGCDPTGVEPCQGIINAAINKLTTSTSGPATIFYPRGTYKLTERIVPKSRVSHIGAGRDQTIFLPFGIRAAFTRSGTPSDYLENCVFAQFTVNGENQVLNGGRYDVGTKGAFFQGFRMCLFTDLRFVDTGATSLGIDFADRSIIQRVLCERGGRLAAMGDPGASGIGIGTGWLQSEPLIIADCISLDCKNYGVFVERQRDAGVQFDARHNIFHGLISRGCGHGFGEAGCAGSIISHSQFTDSVGSGVALHQGTLNNGPHPGVRTLLRSSVIERSGGAGVEFDGRATFGPRGYSSDGNRIEGNAGPGHWIRGGTGGTVDDFALRGDEVMGNSGHGIHVESGTITNFDIQGTRLLNNTGSGIRLDAAIRGGRIHGATIRDLQGTPTQTGSITGSGALTDFDIDGVQGVGCAPIALTGTQTRVTFGRNPGI